jgi:biotin carboxylase
VAVTFLILGARKTYWPVYDTLRRMGIRTVAIDRDPHAGAFSFADTFEVVDIMDREGALNLAKLHHVDAVIALNDLGVRTAAYISGKLGLNGLDMHVADIVNDKGFIRDSWSSAGLPQPEFFVASSIEEAVRAAHHLGYPVIVKPTDCGGGSRGVSVAEDQKELQQAFQFAQHFVKNQRTIIEQYIKGVESQIEILCYHGSAHAITVCDKEMTLDMKYRVSKSINYPAFFDASLVRDIKRLAEAATLAIGITNGAAHVELIVSNDGKLYLQEIGGRPGGAFCSNLIPQLTSGINLIEQLVLIFLGQEPCFKQKFNRGACYRFFFPPPGILKRISGLEHARSMEGVVDLDVYVTLGSTIGPITSGPERVGHVLIEGRDRTAAYALAGKVECMVQFDVEPA